MKTDIIDLATKNLVKYMELKELYIVQPEIPKEKGALVMKCYKAEKLESIMMVILDYFDCRFQQNVEAQSIAIFPHEDYDLPIYELDFIEGKYVIFFSTDLYPVDDIVLNPSYREKYLDALEPHWLKGMGILTGETIQPVAALRAINSPYNLRGFAMPKYETRVDKTLMPSDWARKDLIEVALGYLSVWLNGYTRAEKIDEETKKRVRSRIKSIKGQWARYDTGIEVTKRAFGEELLRKIMAATPLARQ